MRVVRLSFDTECFNDKLFLSDDLILGGAAGLCGGVVEVDSAGEGEGEARAQGVGSLDRGAVQEGVGEDDRGVGSGDRRGEIHDRLLPQDGHEVDRMDYISDACPGTATSAVPSRVEQPGSAPVA